MRTAKQSRETSGVGGRTWQETASLRVEGRVLGCWPASGATWRAREEGRASQGSMELGAATASQAGNLENLSLPICKMGLVEGKGAL